MKINNWFHIIFLFACLSFQVKASAIVNTTNNNSIVSDSLRVDTATVTPKYFEDLKEKYVEEEFIYERSIQKSGWWSRFKQWFNDLFKIKNTGNLTSNADFALNVFYVVIFLLVIFFIVKAILNKEGTWVFGKASDRNIIPVSDIENNIHVTDFDSLIKDAESTNNYRLAVRYYYLWILKSLTSAEIIEYDVEKTNSDYQNEINSKTIRDDFSYASYLYNYMWYGEFDVNEQQFGDAKNAFMKLLKTVEA
ncbi:hypothetical protein [Urechidicola croceus]|uniref:DUF4129 domain-containing protein n=1 Tax=Urechidicola croceus TaxID=1850246 RepID=A0A1D8P4E8_9FLAO|nr:hypothetical protein [Urechidicola croceus]AOW19437.1 hypothetical protein LPB138_01485 [Urechidicola croceus]